jgi:hypothetical protein
MATLVEAAVAEALARGGREVVRTYAAACVERLAPVFLGLRGGDSGRETDVDLFVRTLWRLWDPADPFADAERLAAEVEEFAELRPTETGLTDSADIHCFHAVLALRYAVLCAGTGEAAEAGQCGHVALTAMGLLDQNRPQPGLYDEELEWQRRSVAPAEGLREACAEVGRGRLAVLQGR